LKISVLLFPKQSRSFKGQRWVSIVIRSLHLIGIAGVGAAFLFQLPETQWIPYMVLTLSSGSAMMLLEIWSNGIWLIQLRGLSTLLKLLILSTTFIIGLQSYILVAVILVSGIMSHAPAKVRYYSVFHRKIINSY
jgi:hypothetical protein